MWPNNPDLQPELTTICPWGPCRLGKTSDMKWATARTSCCWRAEPHWPPASSRQPSPGAQPDFAGHACVWLDKSRARWSFTLGGAGGSAFVNQKHSALSLFFLLAAPLIGKNVSRNDANYKKRFDTNMAKKVLTLEWGGFSDASTQKYNRKSVMETMVCRHVQGKNLLGCASLCGKWFNAHRDKRVTIQIKSDILLLGAESIHYKSFFFLNL